MTSHVYIIINLCQHLYNNLLLKYKHQFLQHLYNKIIFYGNNKQKISISAHIFNIKLYENN
jgi:hypothetical protein